MIRAFHATSLDPCTPCRPPSSSHRLSHLGASGCLRGAEIATHNATMECYRRAMIGEQTLEGRRENLNQANKLSRTYASLVDVLDRHRGKGHQQIPVEHLHLHVGARAVAGAVEPNNVVSQCNLEG